MHIVQKFCIALSSAPGVWVLTKFTLISTWNYFSDFYQILMTGPSHHYHLGESTFIFRGVRSGLIFLFYFSIQFLGKHFRLNFLVSKQNCSRWDAALCGVTSWALLFACPIKRKQGLHELCFAKLGCFFSYFSRPIENFMAMH